MHACEYVEECACPRACVCKSVSVFVFKTFFGPEKRWLPIQYLIGKSSSSVLGAGARRGHGRRKQWGSAYE